MTKRSLETDLADASDEVLSDLEPDERLQATLEAHAQGTTAGSNASTRQPPSTNIGRSIARTPSVSALRTHSARPLSFRSPPRPIFSIASMTSR